MAVGREGTSDGTPADRVNKRITRFRIEKIEFFGFGGVRFRCDSAEIAPPYMHRDSFDDGKPTFSNTGAER